jgi:dTDP-4-amino-4,6-dideoxygalactose transaminase
MGKPHDGIVKFVDLKYQNADLLQELPTRLLRLIDKSIFLNGEEVTNFEEEYKKFVGALKVFGVANGTDAIEICIRSLNLPPNSIICVPALSFAATGLAVLRAGYRVIFCDVDLATGSISTQNLEELSIKPDVVIAVSLYGRALDTSLYGWAQKNNIILIEDGAQSHGAMRDGVKSTRGTKVAATSFYPTKNLGCIGDGGAVIVNDAKLIENVSRLKNYGGIKKYSHESFGFNSRLSEIQSIVLQYKLEKLKSWNEERIVIARRYKNALDNVPNVTLPKLDFDGSNVFHLFPVLINERDTVKRKLLERGVETGVHYPKSLPEEGVFVAHVTKECRFPNAEVWAKHNLTLPIYPGISDEKIDRVVTEFLKTIQPL